MSQHLGISTYRFMLTLTTNQALGLSSLAAEASARENRSVSRNEILRRLLDAAIEDARETITPKADNMTDGTLQPWDIIDQEIERRRNQKVSGDADDNEKH